MLIDKPSSKDHSLPALDSIEKVIPSSTICSLNKDTCIESKEIIKIAESTSRVNSKSQLEGDARVDELADELKCLPGLDKNAKQLCIMEKLDKKKEIVKYFKPKTTSFSHNHWLNNTEIDTVQYQFMSNYKGYYYSNIHMIDFGMFHPSTHEHIDFKPFFLKDIDFIKELKGGHQLTSNGPLKNYGVVVNTDVSTGTGIHWFSIFFNFDTEPYSLEYFNSSGYDMKNKEFKKFLINLADEISLKVKPCKFVKVSDIQHQKSTTSNCGVYALYYIWKRLGGTSIDFFRQNKIDDDHVVLFRKYFFRGQN